MARRTVYTSLLLVSMASAVSARASAQILPDADTGGISWKLNKVGDDTYSDTTNTTPINKAQCDANALLDLSLMGIPQGFKYLEVWAGNACNEANRATRIDSTPCVYVNSLEMDPVTTQLASFGVPVETLCELGEGKRTYFILPTNTLMGTDAAASYAAVTLNIDTVPPEPLPAIRLDPNQAQPTLVWTPTPGADTRLRYWLVIDTSTHVGVADQDAGAAADSCGSEQLVPGAEFERDQAGPGVTVQNVVPKTASLALNPGELGPAGSAVAMFVDDLAGNHSVLSNVVCIPATGKSAAKHAGDCSTVAVGERRTGAIAWLTLAAIASSGAWRRGRRRA